MWRSGLCTSRVVTHMRSISTHLLLAIGLFGVGIYYHEDMLLLASNRIRGKKYNSETLTQSTTNSSKYDQVDMNIDAYIDKDIDDVWEVNQTQTNSNNSKYEQVDSINPCHDDNDIDNHWNDIIVAAEVANYTCTGDGPTSIRATLNNSIANISLIENDLDSFISISIAFYAYNNNTQRQQSGGDVFVIDYQTYWPSSIHSSNYTVFKSATFTYDHLNGEYSARLNFPRQQQKKQSVSISLRHYYTCHEGLKLPHQLDTNKGYHELDFGPLYWEEASKAVESLLNGSRKSLAKNDLLPPCSNNNEYILQGGWLEEHPKHPPHILNMSLEAEWTPFDCSLDYNPKNRIPNKIRHYRVGDSTMPGKIVKDFNATHTDKGNYEIKYKIGFPYAPHHRKAEYKGQNDQFMNMLQFFRDEYDDMKRTTSDTFLYSGGLHHLLHGNFNVESIATMVIRTVCQVGLTFPGNIILRGANPIQQHHFPVVDSTSLNVQRINWQLHKYLRNGNRKIAEVCASMVPADDIASFVSLPGSDGHILSNTEATSILLEKYNYSWEANSTDDQKDLVKWFHEMSAEERQTRYGNRTITWINLEGFLLSRPEVYRKGDKIHDSLFFWTHEWNLLSAIEGYQ